MHNAATPLRALPSTACALVALAVGTMAAPFATTATQPQLFPRPTFASWGGVSGGSGAVVNSSAGSIVFTNLTFHCPSGANVLAAAAGALPHLWPGVPVFQVVITMQFVWERGTLDLIVYI